MTKKNNKNKTYTNTFKRKAIKLALEFLSIIGTAKSLGILDATLHTWVRNARNSGEQVITDYIDCQGLVSNHQSKCLLV